MKWVLSQQIFCLCSRRGFRWWCLLGGVYFFYSPVTFSTLPSPPCLTHIAKAPEDGRKALTIPLPQMRSTTQTRAPLNTNAPNLPQLPTAHGVSHDPGLSQLSPCTQNPAEQTLRMNGVRISLLTAGPITLLRLHGKEQFCFVFLHRNIDLLTSQTWWSISS